MKTADVWFRAVLCLSTALMMAISWPLWVTAGEFPRVPWFGWVRLLAPWASWIRFILALLAIAAAGALPFFRNCKLLQGRMDQLGSKSPATDDNAHRIALSISIVLCLWMVLEDQFRLQPWMYQFLLMGIALAACPRERAIMLCRCFVIAQYLHSGLSKLDYEFVHNMGFRFLEHGAKLFGITFNGPYSPKLLIVTSAMPCWELFIATALIVRARRIGIAAAIALHIVLLAILGPRGMNHSANVLIWNAAMIVEVPTLFRKRRLSPPIPTNFSSRIATYIATAIIVAASLLPFGERGGYWDTWPSFALYSSSNETAMFGITGGKNGIPPSIPISGGSSDGNGNYTSVLINVAAWSLQERHAPIYPSARVLNGVAEALGSRYRDRQVIILHSSRADRRTGNRQQVRLEGLDAVRKFGDTFWLNAHPAR